MDATSMQAAIASIGRAPRQRTTLYGTPQRGMERADAAVNAAWAAPARR
jgi:2-iminoacetate synthase ThiH